MTSQLASSKKRLLNTIGLRALALTSTLGITLMCAYAQAQTKEEIYEAYFKDWYQIEVIIFERSEGQSGDRESWPKNITLSYPSNLKFLMSDDALKEHQATLDQQDSGATLSTEESAKNRRLLQQLRQGGSSDPDYQKLISSIEASEIERLAPKEMPFVELAPQLRVLNDDAKRLDRNRSMSVLFHQAWRQPIANKSNMSAIVVRGGEQFDQHYELEGSISFFVGRYLHAYTNLWLSEFEANFGQETQHWPLLPSPPWASTALDNISLDASDATGISNNTELKNWRIDTKTDDNFRFGDVNNNALLDNYDSLTATPFIQKELVAMRQKRRMRSGELHYIDHPKIGIILRIDQYKPDES